nr:GNAT family protein [Prevotella sp.]
MKYILRNYLVEEDLEYFHKVHSDGDSMRYYGMEPTNNIEESQDLMTTYLVAIKQGNMIHQVVADAITNEYVGEIGLFNINKQHHRANSYCILLPEYRKRGISKYISPQFYDFVFSTTCINRIQAHVDSRNLNAKKSLIGIGYNYEGRLKEYELDKGEYIDIDVYSLLCKNFYKR